MTVAIRCAERRDLPALVRLLQQLSLDEPREDLSEELAPGYVRAFEEIDADRRLTLLVAEDGGEVVGTAAVNVIPNLSHVGKPYCFVEDVVVDGARRGERIGEALMARAVEIAREAGCYKVVLTSHKVRADAHRFYRRIGFTATHEGFRLDL
jgi:GNAT superfamily N-acetyltransferase